MPENRNRLRPKQIKFFVNDKEYELIENGTDGNGQHECLYSQNGN